MELFLKHYNLSRARIAVLGKGTKRKAEELGVSISFTPELDDTEEAVKEFAEALEPGAVVLYPKGKQSLGRLNEAIESSQLIDFIFYDTVNKEFPRAHSTHLLFTSPSNVNAYFGRYHLASNQQAYAIGKSTEAALSNWGIDPARVAKSPSEEGFWKALN